jgi:GntR family transcriptional regulator, histidine utilization repressor
MTARPPGLERRIRGDLEEAIRSGAWRPGQRIPTEAALMQQYGCARMTASAAVGALAAAGLVVRRKKAGSFVAHPQVHAAVLEIPDLRAVIEARGETYAYQGLARTVRRPDPANPEEVALGASGEVLALEGLHIAHGAPFALERRVISLTAAPEAVMQDFSSDPPGSWLLRQVAWSEAEHRIGAVNPSASEARLLGVGRAEACLQVKRWTWRGGQAVTFVAQLFPGALYDLVARFGNAPRATA